MSFDGLLFRRVIQLLASEITGANINRVSQLSANDFIFSLYRPNFKSKLLISTNNNASYITLSALKYDDLLPANHFMSVMRRHLEGGIILDVKQMGLDRIFCLSVRLRDELGDYSIRHLYVELTGKMTNIIITWEDDSIIDCLHRLGPITQRIIMPGARYRLPPTPDLKDPLTSKYDASCDLSTQFYGFSKNLEKEVQYRLSKGENFHSIISELLSSNSCYSYQNDYHLIPFKHLDVEPKKSVWHEGILEFYRQNQIDTKRKEAIKVLLNIAKKQAKHYKVKMGRLEDELISAKNSNIYKEYGDLLFSYVEDLNQKCSEITVKNIESNKSITIPLDERLTITANAQEYYKKYRKLENSKQILKEQIALATSEYEYFELLKIQIMDADRIELEQISNELQSLGLVKSLNKPKKNKEKRFAPHTFITPSGLEVSVGFNNMQNDYLTHRLAKYNEYFFHVKDYPGSHVVVHSTNQLDEETIRFAANLAAYYSKARLSSSVPVDYTIVKNVKKHPSNKPGMVILKNYKTIYIDAIKPKEA